MKKSELIKITVLLYLSVVITVLLVKLSSFEIPDLSGINEVVKKANDLTIMAENLTSSLMDYKELFDEKLKVFNNAWDRLDVINGTDLMIETLPYIRSYYVNWSDCN